MDSALVDLLSINLETLIAAFVFGVIGFCLYREGRKRDHTITWGIGISLMLYPYFISGALLTWMIGCALCTSAFFFWKK